MGEVGEVHLHDVSGKQVVVPGEITRIYWIIQEITRIYWIMQAYKDLLDYA